MKKLKLAAMTAAAIFAVSGANAATVVNLNGVANASLNGSNAVNVALAAGTYKLTFTQDQYTAFTRFSGVTGCDGAGANCTQGYENSARFVIGGTTYKFGDGAASGGIGPLNPGDGYYDTAAHSLAQAGGYSTTFTVGAGQSADFFIYDDNLADNSGGVSLLISAVPEPATWAMMIGGFGLIGGAMRRRKVAKISFA